MKKAVLRAEEASSSPSASGHRYQVFLSFRGRDTRKNFTDHLYTALVQARIHTFKDEHELERGENIAYELDKAIGESKIAVIVFSRNYAESEWCLDELVRILERKKTIGLTVIPVFYDVQPSHVRYQRGSFGEAFSVLEEFEFESEELMKKMEKWRAALREVADLGGMVLQNEADGIYRYESKFIQEIVEHIKRKLNPTPYLNLNPNPNPVQHVVRMTGMDRHIKRKLNPTRYPNPSLNPNPVQHVERMTGMGSSFSGYSRGYDLEFEQDLKLFFYVMGFCIMICLTYY